MSKQNSDKFKSLKSLHYNRNNSSNNLNQSNTLKDMNLIEKSIDRTNISKNNIQNENLDDSGLCGDAGALCGLVKIFTTICVDEKKSKNQINNTNESIRKNEEELKTNPDNSYFNFSPKREPLNKSNISFKDESVNMSLRKDDKKRKKENLNNTSFNLKSLNEDITLNLSKDKESNKELSVSPLKNILDKSNNKILIQDNLNLKLILQDKRPIKKKITIKNNKNKGFTKYGDPDDEEREKENDVASLMELEGFPCQLNDYSELSYTIDEMNKWEEQFSFADILELNMSGDEKMDCMIEGMCSYEDNLVMVFLVLTTKQIIFYTIVTNQTVKVIKSIDINSIERIFINGRELIFLKRLSDSKIIEKFEFKIGFDDLLFKAKNRNSNLTSNNTTLNKTTTEFKTNLTDLTKNPNKNEADQDESKVQAHVTKKRRELIQIKNAFLFCISIWRIYFINNNVFLNIMKIYQKSYLEGIPWENNYMEKLYRNLLQLKVEFINTYIIKLEKEKFLLIRQKMKQQKGYNKSKDKTHEIKAKEENDANNKIDHKYDGVAYIIYDDPGRTFEFNHSNLKFCKVILKFYKNDLIIYDIGNELISFLDINLIESIYINDSRFLILIYLYPNENLKETGKKNNQEKLILFHNSSLDDEFQFFRSIVIRFLEMKRLNLLNFELYFGTAQKIYSKFIGDGLPYYSISRNNVLIKTKEESLAKLNAQKFENIVIAKKKCCGKNIIQDSKTVTENLKNQFMKSMDNKKEGCNIY